MHARRMRSYLTVLMIAALVVVGPSQTLGDVKGEMRVIDADTIEIDGVRIRLFGIDAPEQGQTCTSQAGKIWNCGAWVSSVVRERYEGAHARCEQKDTDRYGRLVATCFVAGTDMAEVLVTEGLAFAYRKYSMDYDFTEKGAAIRGVGLHSSDLQSPAAFRRSATVSDLVAAGCRIKGNISAKGTRIFHSPGQRDYDKTRISATKGERWFCTAAEAEAAGWRPARR